MPRYARWLSSILIPAFAIVTGIMSADPELYIFSIMWLIFQPLAFLLVFVRHAGRWYGSRTADATE